MKARNMRYIHFDKFRSSSADQPGNKRVCIANMTHLIGWGGIGGGIFYILCSCLSLELDRTSCEGESIIDLD